MPKKSKTIIADADILIALAYHSDTNHQKVKEITTKLLEKLYIVMFPNTALLEAITVLKRALNQPDLADKINKQYQRGVFGIIYIDEQIQLEASKLFNPAGSKKNTIFDAIVLATAKNVSADAVFSFDSWYKKQNFPLAQDLV